MNDCVLVLRVGVVLRVLFFRAENAQFFFHDSGSEFGLFKSVFVGATLSTPEFTCFSARRDIARNLVSLSRDDFTAGSCHLTHGLD